MFEKFFENFFWGNNFFKKVLFCSKIVTILKIIWFNFLFFNCMTILVHIPLELGANYLTHGIPRLLTDFVLPPLSLDYFKKKHNTQFFYQKNIFPPQKRGGGLKKTQKRASFAPYKQRPPPTSLFDSQKPGGGTKIFVCRTFGPFFL